MLHSQAEEIVWCQAQSDWVVEFDSIGHGRHGMGYNMKHGLQTSDN